MKISTKGRYGLRAMIDLAIHSNGEFVSLGSIARRQNISLNYLEHAFSALKKAGFVTGMSGSGGGYMLAEDPASITVQMILYVLEGDLSVVDRIPLKAETPLQALLRQQLWEPINANVKEVIAMTTLKDMAEEYKKMNKL